MNILRPNGDIYAKVYLEGDYLCISLGRYQFNKIVKMDSKVIPQLIQSLRNIAADMEKNKC